jgi:hypothetical protein
MTFTKGAKKCHLWHRHGARCFFFGTERIAMPERLMPWMLVAGLVACAPQRDQAPQPTATPTAGSATATSGGSVGIGGSGGAGGTAGAAGDGGSGAVFDATSEGATPDGAPDTPLVVIHKDAASSGAACANNFTALGSNRLLAGSSTPAAFAAAYNAELAASSTAGPLLMALYGVNETSLLRWIAKVGALEPSDAGAGVGFAGRHVDVPFTLASDRSLTIPAVAADFELKLATPAGPALLPIGAIALHGLLSAGCGSLAVDKATLLVPERAGKLAFHGSTVEALMGPPTETLRGVDRSAWPLELSGKAFQVYAPGLLGDSGIEP